MNMQLPEEIARDTSVPRTRPKASACLLEYRHGCFVAFPVHTALELLERPPRVTVPGAPYYCGGLIAWQQRQLPLLDLNTLLRAYPETRMPHLGHALILAYQSAPWQPLAYGALFANALVRMVNVTDRQQCALPRDSDLWPQLALSCFVHEGKPVPVLDTARLFSQPHG